MLSKTKCAPVHENFNFPKYLSIDPALWLKAYYVVPIFAQVTFGTFRKETCLDLLYFAFILKVGV